jgi:tRNA U34 5-carboxymethylaminomethyl modifying GTPase MnmE/TrmE
MEKRNTNQASEAVTKADLVRMKTEIIEADKETVKGLALQETVSAVLETVAETKEGLTELKGHIEKMMEELTATHEDVRSGRNTVTMLAQSDAAYEAVIESLRKRLERVERKVGIAK